ncbi:unnamed protein product [Mytilus coruscus]|uniref:B box-type domain-containing protein n=1 Tax=Mytilus coruscus TaxID=42192 RepID=A0A6J8F032_MYTCO|nr:unnamed protein product [Mytilus coruscus]
MAQAAASTCEICIGGPGEHYCQQCNQLFCGSCKLSHLRANICKNHTFLSGPKKEDKLLCTEHEERCLSYCHDCDTTVCRVCSVERHSRHLMTDLAKSTIKLRSELAKQIELKVATSKQSISKIEKETQTYRDKVKAVIKTITDEGNYWTKLINEKIEALIKSVQDREQKEIQSMAAYSEVYKGVVETCQTWQKSIKKMETTEDVLMLQKLKQLKTDVDQIVLKPIPDAPSVSYRNKKHSATQIDNLFAELQFPNGKAVLRQTENKQSAKPQAMQKRYRYTCNVCGEIFKLNITKNRQIAILFVTEIGIQLGTRYYVLYIQTIEVHHHTDGNVPELYYNDFKPNVQEKYLKTDILIDVTNTLRCRYSKYVTLKMTISD